MCYFYFFHPSAYMSILLLIPLILDGGMQALTYYESTNKRRFLTGMLFGYALSNLFFLSTGYVFQYGYTLVG